MLRIIVRDEGEYTSFTLEGRVTANVTAELEACWRAALVREPLKPIVVNLAAVTFLDSKSTELLATMRREGVRLIPTGYQMKAIVRQIEAEIGDDNTDMAGRDEKDGVALITS